MSEEIQASLNATVTATTKAVVAVRPMTLYWAVTDPVTGVVTRHGHGPATNAAMTLTQLGAQQISAEQFQLIRSRTGKVAIKDGQVVPVPPAAPDLAKLRATFDSKVDQAADQMRGRYVPKSAGGVLEYMIALTEARAVVGPTGPTSPTDFPWLSADVAAAAARGQTLTLQEAAANVIAANAAWEKAGVAIRQMVQSAKAAIATATTPAEMQLIVSGLKAP